MPDRHPPVALLPSLAMLVAGLALAASACAGGSSPSVDLANTCSVGCHGDQECGAAGWCSGGTCKKRAYYCGDGTTSYDDRGASADCTPFACDSSTGRCFTSAGSSSECAPSWPYDDVSGHCAYCTQNGCSLTGGGGWLSLGDASAITCSATCAHDRECGAGNMCWQGRCVYRANYCEWSQETGPTAIAVDGALDPAGDYGRTRTSCGGYACDPVAGQCYTQCFNTNECNGLTCDPQTFTCI